MRVSFLVFIFVIGILTVYGDDDDGQNTAKKGLVQVLFDSLLSHIKNKPAEVQNNNTMARLVFSFFKKIYNRAYLSGEEQTRFNTFKQSLLNIITINVDSTLTYDAEINAYTDLKEQEFNSQKKGLITSDSSLERKRKRHGFFSDVVNSVLGTSTTSSLDWVSRGFVTSVKDQKNCGDCYAFATIAVIEGAWMRKTGQLVNFSPQELTDCSSGKGNHGCNGGNFAPSVTYLNSISGRLSTWTGYPYTNAVGSCHTSLINSAASYKLSTIQYSQITKGDENSLLEALKLGPVYVGINAAASAFQSYRSGVLNLNSNLCSPNGIDHAVTLVGYGHDPTTGLDYWKIKNSWSPSWGETGYVRLARGRNICGIANMAYKVISL